MELRESQRTQSDMVYSAELNLILIGGLIADKLSNKRVRSLWLHTPRKSLLYTYQELFSAELSRFSCITVIVYVCPRTKKLFSSPD